VRSRTWSRRRRYPRRRCWRCSRRGRGSWGRCRCGSGRWRPARAGVTARAWSWRICVAEVLGKDPACALHTRDIQLIAARLDSAEDKIKPFAGIILIQSHLEIRRLIVIGEIHRAPFDVKNTIGRAAGDRGKDATAAGEGRTTLAHNVGAIIAPDTENGVVIWTLVRWSWQTH